MGGFFALARLRFALQSNRMETKQAAEHLEVIRTLMERSALYRRALAPIMLFAGLVGSLTVGIAWLFHLDSINSFLVLWLSAAVAAIVGAFLIARRQAIKDRELFWSPPTRRVVKAILMPFLAAAASCLLVIGPEENVSMTLVFIWTLSYGYALNAAGVFMPRGIKVFSWVYFVCAVLLISWGKQLSPLPIAHWAMGTIFGGSHLAYGIYLYLTENRNTAP